jgi:hypothetical protein
MKCIDRIGKQNLIYENWGYAYANGIVLLAEGLEMLRILMDDTIGQCVL